MEKLSVTLSNCYGISSFNETFDFSTGRPETARAFAIYAPNGLMKTSFAKTFEALSKEKAPKEERFNRPSTCVVLADGAELDSDQIYVLKSEVDIHSESAAVSNILVNLASKERYDQLVEELNKTKGKLVNSLQKLSGVKKADIEQTLLTDFGVADFSECVRIANELEVTDDISVFVYQEIFDPKAIALLESQEFVTKAEEFNERYQDLFESADSIYKRGVFNPVKADVSFSTLRKQGYFQGGHRVHLDGDEASINEDELQVRLSKTLQSIESDAELSKIQLGISKNAQTQAIGALLETLSAPQLAYLLAGVKKENQADFKRQLWAFYVQNSSVAGALLETYEESREEIHKIEQDAALEAPQWQAAIVLFNDRFLDMPFELSLFNPGDAALGKQQAKLKFCFKEGDDQIECSREEIRSLSHGEKRALYLLNFIFEVEDRKRLGKTTLFIIDDAADSFDYKNKHAIVQYLKDISRENHFYQIILTHNYDFFRTISTDFVYRPRCLMAGRREDSIGLSPAKGIKNYFVGEWKPRIGDDEIILCATVPFTRNIVEYTKGSDDPDFLRLTNLLHWKEDTAQITVGNYLSIYNNTFGTQHSEDSENPFVDLLFEKADEIAASNEHDSLNLENKVLLSIAIRLKAEIFLTDQLRLIKHDDSYWCLSTGNQFGELMKEFITLHQSSSAIQSLEKVSLTVSSNIHLNAFMYEPILDLTVEHLVSLYSEIKNLTA